jgi:hypothetical protein
MSANNLRVVLKRLWKDKNQSTGILYIIDDKGQPVFGALSLERGDRNNESNVSNIPAGTYNLILTYSPKFKKNKWLVQNVPNRDGIRIHSANKWDELNGCIALGLRLKDINNDGYYDITNSTDAVLAFETMLKGINKTTIKIIDNENI